VRGMVALLLLKSPRHTLTAVRGRSAAGPSHSRHFVTADCCTAKGSLDHVVGASKDRLRNRKPERVCSLEIDRKLELGRLLDR
jgi:hypothetical protein